MDYELNRGTVFSTKGNLKMADSSLNNLFKGVLPPELVTKVEGILDNFDSSGNLAVEMDLSVADDLTVTSDASIGGNLTVSTDASVTGKLTVTGDIAAGGGFKTVAGMFGLTDAIATGTSSQSGMALAGIPAGAVVLPSAGSVMGLAANCSEVTAGSSLVFTVFKNGVATTAELTLAIGAQKGSLAVAKDTVTFVAGDVLDVRYKNHGTNWTATTLDATIALVVEF